LNAAKSSAESLLPIYEEALILLEMVRDDSAHVLYEEDNYVPLHYNAKEYFDKGNFARPYCDVKLIERGRVSLLPVASMTVGRDATALRDSAIEEAKKIKDPTERIKIAVGLEDAKRLGKAGKYQEAFDILIKIHNMAYKADIYHEELEWAIGSCAFVLYSRTQESKLLLQATTYFKGLTNKHPDNIQYKFDYANVILSTDFEKGMELLLPVVEDKRYNYFLKNIGRMYDDKGKNADAISAYCKYKELYPNDTEIDSLINSCKNKTNED
jgi:tetratricopeptide (TPR) repeat protein